jgi:hypothetical protein
VWLPIYVQPLEETLEAPLFPAVGRSDERGWFAKWSLPYFLSEALYGNVNVDVFTRYGEVGLGGVLRYDVGGQKGELAGYRLPAKVGDSETMVKLEHTSKLAPGWEGTGRLAYDQKGERERLSYSFLLSGSAAIGDFSLAATRDLRSTTAGATRLSERLPEATLDLAPIRWGAARIEPRLTAGWLTEGILGEPLRETFRLSARAAAVADAVDLGGLRVVPEASVYGSLYDGPRGRQTQLTLALTPTAAIGDLDLAWSSTWAFGSSPLDSDQSTTGHEIRWSVEREGLLDLKVSGSLDLLDGPGLVRAVASWHALADWTVSSAFSPAESAITEFDLRATWTDGTRTATWQLPLDATDRRFKQTSFTLSSKSSDVLVSLRVDAALAPFAVSKWNLHSEVESQSGWGLTLGATYSASASNRIRPELGLFKDIAQCLRVGVEQAKGETWLYISILAFPEAILRYAPRTFEVEVGD